MGKVLRISDAADFAYVSFFHTATTDVWYTFRLGLTAEAIALWTASGSSNYAAFMTNDRDYLYIDDPDSYSGAWNGQESGETGASPSPVVGWQDCEFHYVASGGTNEFYIGGALVWSGTSSTGDATLISLGIKTATQPLTDPDAIFYYDDVKVGTTRGGSDIFADDFESGDLSAWPETIGDVSVVDDPFAITTPAGINIAFPNNALDENPTWTRLDADPYRLIDSWSVSRGKDSELDKSSTGTATLSGNDRSGLVDPTNAGGPFYGNLSSQKPALIMLQHPFTLEWHSIFRGFVDRYEHSLEMFTDDRGIDRFRIDLYDGFGYLSRVTLMPTVHGHSVSIADFADIYYQGTPSNLTGEANVFVHVDDRIVKLLDDAGWPNTGEKRVGLRDIFSGNVSVQGSVVDRGDGLMSALGDAVDAEFPGKANHYMSKEGVYRFRGRFAFLNPENPGYGINFWNAGTATIARSDSTVAAIAGLEFSDQELINSCGAWPQGVTDADVPGNLVEDAASIALYGRSSANATFPDLITSAGHNDDLTPTTAVEETRKFADFYVGNQKDPRTVVTALSFVGLSDPVLGPAVADLMCGVEIGDVISLQTTHPGGGGFDEELLVDHIEYEAQVGEPVRMTLQVSPRPTYNPFGDVDIGVS